MLAGFFSFLLLLYLIAPNEKTARSEPAPQPPIVRQEPPARNTAPINSPPVAHEIAPVVPPPAAGPARHSETPAPAPPKPPRKNIPRPPKQDSDAPAPPAAQPKDAPAAGYHAVNDPGPAIVGEVEIQVEDTEANPLDMVTVHFNDHDYVWPNGTGHLKGVPGPYTLRFSRSGYRSESRQINVTAEKRQETIRLRRFALP
jgi:hypothetical protein